MKRGRGVPTERFLGADLSVDARRVMVAGRLEPIENLACAVCTTDRVKLHGVTERDRETRIVCSRSIKMGTQSRGVDGTRNAFHSW